jgi:hypothetical protein
MLSCLGDEILLSLLYIYGVFGGCRCANLLESVSASVHLNPDPIPNHLVS